MLKKVINVGGKEVAFRSSATVPRLYRAKFKRDIFKDLAKLESSYKGSKEDGEEFAIDDLEIFENVAYMTGLTSSRCFLSTKFCQKSLHFGVQTLLLISSLKKT